MVSQTTLTDHIKVFQITFGKSPEVSERLFKYLKMLFRRTCIKSFRGQILPQSLLRATGYSVEVLSRVTLVK